MSQAGFPESLTVRIQASKQGKFPEFQATSVMTGLSIEAPATGGKKAKPVHEHVTFRHHAGRVTPLLLQALATREPLATVTFTHLRPDGDGVAQVVYRIALSSALVLSVRHTLPDTDAGRDAARVPLLADVVLTFGTIKWDSIVGATSFGPI